MYKNALLVSLVPSDIRRGCWSPWIIVTNSCEPSDDMGHLKKQPVPLKWGCLNTGADIQREPNGGHKTKVTWAQSKAYKIARSWEAILGRRVLLDTAEGAQPCPTAICGLGTCEHTHFSTRGRPHNQMWVYADPLGRSPLDRRGQCELDCTGSLLRRNELGPWKMAQLVKCRQTWIWSSTLMQLSRYSGISLSL